ncbi:hypothetical protein [Novosphingobium sp.]|uniref:hypothetical protein n=1 Tax=Novosphingobium sp. TaxID=1874826 RepID=UPI0033423A3A
MTDSTPRPESNAAARAEAAATRRRWITFGEVLTVIAVIISALTFWSNWTQRNADQAQKTAEANKAAVHSATLVLTATNAGKRELALKPTSSVQSVQDQHIAFPTALGVTAADTTGEPRIDATWFEHALIKAREAAHLPDNSRGDAQLPVAITTRFLVDGDERTDVALYDVGYSVSSGFLGSHSVTLRGVALIARVKADTAQARLDARWSRILPHKQSTVASSGAD